MSVFLGFDYGLKRVGVAVGQRVTASASALSVLKNTGSETLLGEIAGLISTWRPVGLIVGLPLLEDGFEQPMSTRARRFAADLEQRFKLPITLVDERYTSRSANDDFREARAAGVARKKHASTLDARAAQRILQQFLQS